MKNRAELAAQVIERVLNGMSLTASCAEVQMTLSAFAYALSIHKDLAVSYARAREIRADVLVDQSIEAADSDLDPQKVRNMVQVRQWTAAKWNRGTYGERVDLNVTQQISVNEALEAAKTRLLRPVCDQLPIEDATLVESPGTPAIGHTDNESVLPASSLAAAPPVPVRNDGPFVPDIFR